jgi:hypothetical protein
MAPDLAQAKYSTASSIRFSMCRATRSPGTTSAATRPPAARRVEFDKAPSLISIDRCHLVGNSTRGIVEQLRKGHDDVRMRPALVRFNPPASRPCVGLPDTRPGIPVKTPYFGASLVFGDRQRGLQLQQPAKPLARFPDAIEISAEGRLEADRDDKPGLFLQRTVGPFDGLLISVPDRIGEGERGREQITKAHILAMVNDLSETRLSKWRGNDKGGSLSKASGVLRHLRTCFCWAVDEDLLERDPSAGVRDPSGKPQGRA